ncbi:AfsR/SARP family transcriptional regulator [Nonomuraea typhae]|uniref:AfsR/SARP family transcriptional regulator n=1 Tax=Nonomuraea typhae TaxID=2603600 RepID=UPI0012F71A21|nr:AfsR/SARP family transcriptional regulator [Nonomuraea typhae]
MAADQSTTNDASAAQGEGDAFSDHLRVGLLGPVLAWRDGSEISLGAAKQRALISALALNADKSLSHPWLIEALWGDDAPETAVQSLYTYVFELRRLLEPARPHRSARLLVSENAGYRLRLDPERVDAVAFPRRVAQARQLLAAGRHEEALEELESALEMWRGNALTGIPGPYAEAQRIRLEDVRLAALEERAQVLLATRRHEEAVAELAGLVKEFPLREKLHSLLMMALYRCGRQAEALEHYTLARSRLVAELAVEPGKDLRGLHERILRGDPALDFAADPLRPARALPVVPRQLPSDVPDFIGRSAALARLEEMVARPSPAPVVISGMGGVGKTVLAVHFAHLVADRFADGHLFADLHGFDPAREPTPPGEVLGHWLWALGVSPALIPDELDAKATLFRSLVADKSMIIIVDNARSAGQVRPLLPGSASCLTLVTSRRRLTGLIAREGARDIGLEAFARAETVALLNAVVGDRVAAEPAAVATIVKLTGGLPLAVRIAGARTALGSARTLHGVADRLAADRGLDAFSLAPGDDAADLRAVFSWSFRALGPAAARLFRLIGLHPGPLLTAPVAAALARTSLAAAHQALDALSEAHLVQESGPGCFRLHDLISAYAVELAEELPPRERASVTERMLRHYLHTAHAASLLLIPPGGVSPLGPQSSAGPFASRAEALDWFRIHLPNLAAAVPLAARTGYDEIAWQLPLVVWEYLLLTKPWTAWLPAYRVALEAATRVGDRAAAAWVQHDLAFAHKCLRHFGEAYVLFQQAHRTRHEIGDRWGRAWSLMGMGTALSSMGRHAEAIVCLQPARAVFSQVGNTYGESMTLIGLSEACSAMGRYEDALAFAVLALEEHARQDGQLGMGYALHCAGHACRLLGRDGEAVGYLERALEVRQRMGDRWGRAQTLKVLGELLCDGGQVTIGVDLLHQALRTFSQVSDPLAEDICAFLAASDYR